jgi:hypothetical protein
MITSANAFNTEKQLKLSRSKLLVANVKKKTPAQLQTNKRYRDKQKQQVR